MWSTEEVLGTEKARLPGCQRGICTGYAHVPPAHPPLLPELSVYEETATMGRYSETREICSPST